MAIAEDLPGVEVTVVVDGAALKEHVNVDADAEDDECTLTRYIEAASGKKFEVHIKVSKDFEFLGDALSVEIFINGNLADVPLIRMLEDADSDYEAIVTGVAIAADTIKEFVFCSLETATDGHMFKGEREKVESLGTIQVDIAHQNIKGLVEKPSYLGATAEEEVGVVSEKALKGQSISHTVNYGPAIDVEACETFDSEPVDGCFEPCMSFVFQYRSLEALKSMLIIPRTPTPPPLEERDFDTLTPEEIRELQRQVRANKEKEASAVKIKREARDENPRPRKKARPSAGATQLELDDDGVARASSTPTATVEPEVIELD